MAAAFLTAAVFVFCSCSRQQEAVPVDRNSTPIQTIVNMDALESDYGILKSRIAAPLMQRFEGDSTSWELFPKGFSLYSYTADGQLETKIVADHARHITTKGKEEWMAYGHVVIKNFQKDETMESDTLFWDRANQRIYTRCYVKMYSPGGFLQGFGMESDEKASNAIILVPYDSYAVVDDDSTKVYVDPANFIGPVIK